MVNRCLVRALIGLTAVLGVLAASGPAAAADTTKPTTPSNLRATAAATTSVSLAWNASTDNSGSLTYTVKELNSGQTHAVPQSQTTHVWTGLQASKTYRFVVYARDAAGNQSANSNTVTVTTPQAALPPAPANFRVTAATMTTVSLAWDASPGATSYYLRRDGTYVTTSFPQTSYTVTGLTPGTTYAFTVQALNSAGQSAWTAVPGTTLPDLQPPTTPVVTPVVAGPSVVRLSWPASTDNLPYVSYNVYSGALPARSMLPLGPESVELQNLRAATTYTFSVRAYDSAGNLSAPGTVTVTTPAGTDTVPPAPPQSLRLNGPARTSVASLRWDAAGDDVGVTAYEVFMDGAFVDEVLPDVFYPGVVFPWFDVRHLAPGSTHVFAVRARDESGNLSPFSAPLTTTLPASSDVTAPTAPAIQWADTSPNCAFINLAYSGSTDDSGLWVEYEVWEDGRFLQVDTGEVPAGSFGRHTYTVRAVDQAGNTSAPSNAIVLDNGLRC